MTAQTTRLTSAGQNRPERQTLPDGDRLVIDIVIIGGLVGVLVVLTVYLIWAEVWR